MSKRSRRSGPPFRIGQRFHGRTGVLAVAHKTHRKREAIWFQHSEGDVYLDLRPLNRLEQEKILQGAQEQLSVQTVSTVKLWYPDCLLVLVWRPAKKPHPSGYYVTEIHKRVEGDLDEERWKASGGI